MLLLALDTSTSAVTVALHDGMRVLAEAATLDPRRHAEVLALGIAEVLHEADVTARDVTSVVVGAGPGPFTGLRVGLVTARAFGFARGIPVHGLCSLDALAHQAWTSAGPGLGDSFVVATDARRSEVYSAVYDVTAEGAVRRGEPGVRGPAALAEILGGRRVVGRGALLYAELLGEAVPPLDVSAGALAELAVRHLAAGRPLAPADPLYLRRPDARPPAARKPVLS